jgi:hypothetical protein
MARKKTEAVKALEAMAAAARPTCTDCEAPAILTSGDGKPRCGDCADARHAREAAGALERAGLQREPGEPAEAYRKRMFRWLRQTVTVKRFGTAREETA